MKIAVLGTRGFPDVQGGVENHCENLYTQLVDKGCAVTVFARKPYVGSAPKDYHGIRIVSLPCPKNKFLETFVHTFLGIFEVKHSHADILHIHAIGPSLFAPLARMLGIKVVITHHGPDYERKKWGIVAKHVLKMGEFLGVTYANGVIGVSDSIVGQVRKKYRKEASSIPNGVPLANITADQDVLTDYGVEAGKYLLCVGRFVPEKGFHDIIKAYVAAGVPEYKLVIAGDADHDDAYSSGLKELARSTPGVVLTGFIGGKSLSQFYSHAGLFVLPSYYEGLPIVLLEAMSYGVSCVISDIPANQEVPIGRDRFFMAGDVEGMAVKIAEFIKKPLSTTEKEAQQYMIVQKYDWAHIAEQTMEVYRSVGSV